MKTKKPFVAPTIEEQIQALQKQLDENPSARDAAPLRRLLAQLTGATKKSRQQQWKDRKAEQLEPPKPKPEPLCIRRGTLIESVADRLRNASEQVLTPEEIQAATAVNFTPEELLTSVKNFIWDTAHPNEVRALRESFVEDMVVPSPEFSELMAAVKTNQPGSWVRFLKAFPRVTVNAGGALTPDELRDVEQARQFAAVTRDRRRRDLYERFPDRFAKELTQSEVKQ